MNKGWKYYNHALIPACAPHELPDLDVLESPKLWSKKTWGAAPLLARWSIDWNSEEETGWWYVISDAPFDLNSLTSKKRYEIKKGLRTYDIKKIQDLSKFKEDLFLVAYDAYQGYSKAYRPSLDYEKFVEEINKWEKYDVYGAFSKEDGKIKAWARLNPFEKYVDFEMMKSIQAEEKKGVNAALVYGILMDYNLKLANGYYICDGARNIIHETRFQDYLEKYFNFRKVYCRLCIKYSPQMFLLVKVLFPFRNVLKRMNGMRSIRKINGILKMEEIVRQGKSCE